MFLRNTKFTDGRTDGGLFDDLYITPNTECSQRYLNSSFRLQGHASLTGLDDLKFAEFLPAIFKYLNFVPA